MSTKLPATVVAAIFGPVLAITRLMMNKEGIPAYGGGVEVAMLTPAPGA